MSFEVNKSTGIKQDETDILFVNQSNIFINESPKIFPKGNIQDEQNRLKFNGHYLKENEEIYNNKILKNQYTLDNLLFSSIKSSDFVFYFSGDEGKQIKKKFNSLWFLVFKSSQYFSLKFNLQNPVLFGHHLMNVLVFFHLDEEQFLTALTIFQRYYEVAKNLLNITNESILFYLIILCIIVSIKGLDDHVVKLNSYCKLLNLDNSRIVNNEMQLLTALNFSLFFTKEDVQPLSAIFPLDGFLCLTYSKERFLPQYLIKDFLSHIINKNIPNGVLIDNSGFPLYNSNYSYIIDNIGLDEMKNELEEKRQKKEENEKENILKLDSSVTKLVNSINVNINIKEYNTKKDSCFEDELNKEKEKEKEKGEKKEEKEENEVKDEEKSNVGKFHEEESENEEENEMNYRVNRINDEAINDEEEQEVEERKEEEDDDDDKKEEEFDDNDNEMEEDEDEDEEEQEGEGEEQEEEENSSEECNEDDSLFSKSPNSSHFNTSSNKLTVNNSTSSSFLSTHSSVNSQTFIISCSNSPIKTSLLYFTSSIPSINDSFE